MSNEWNQCSCKWAGATVSPCPGHADFSDPGCGPDGLNAAGVDTPIWDALFRLVRAEDPSGHLTSIHNNGYLYNYSEPWITHFSIQHTHNKPSSLWKHYGRKPVVWDEVKYEGDNANNWGSLSAPQMVNRFWWAAAVGYGTFRLDFHRFDRFELDLRGHIHVRGAAFSWLRLTLADVVLICRFYGHFPSSGRTAATARSWPAAGSRGAGAGCSGSRRSGSRGSKPTS